MWTSPRRAAAVSSVQLGGRVARKSPKGQLHRGLGPPFGFDHCDLLGHDLGSLELEAAHAQRATRGCPALQSHPSLMDEMSRRRIGLAKFGPTCSVPSYGRSNGPKSTAHVAPSAGVTPSSRYRETTSSVHCEGISGEVWPHPSTVSRAESGINSSTTTAFS